MRILMIILLAAVTHLAWSADLQAKDVEQWLKTSPQLQAWLEQQESKLAQAEELDETLDDQAAMQQAIAQLKKVGVYDELNKKVNAAGYQDVAQWLVVSQQITMAYLAEVLAEDMSASQELEQQRQALEAADMPAEQKEMLKAMLDSSLAMMNEINNIPQADRAAIKPYMLQLKALVDDE